MAYIGMYINYLLKWVSDDGDVDVTLTESKIKSYFFVSLNGVL